MTSSTSAMTRAARGIFLGAAVGDALGWPQEVRGGLVGGQKERDRATPQPRFRSWTRHAGHYSSRYRDPVRPGEYSDDTQLLLAAARSCLAGERWWERLTKVELPAWPLYQRGGGGAVLTAAASWADGHPPWRGDGGARVQAAEQRYRNAGANGVAMRIAPHVLWADTPTDLIRRTTRDGITTHGHPRALLGALVYAFALRHAASSRTTHGYGDSVDAAAAGLVDVDQILPALPPDWGTAHDLEEFASTWGQTKEELSQLLELVADSLHRGAMSNPEATLEQLGCTDSKISGAGTVSAAAAIYLASRFAARPQGGLLSAAFLRKADTDTLASLTAAILGALHDTHWLGDLAADVQDADYIGRLAERSAARVAEPPPWPTRHPGTLRRELTDALHSRRDVHGEFPDGRRYHLDEIADLHDGHRQRARLRLDDGQTVFVDLHGLAAEPDGAGNRHNQKQSRQPKPAPRWQGSFRRSADAAGDEATSTPPATPPVADHSGKRKASAILTTRSLTRSAAFYARLTGRDIPIHGGTAEITPGLLLHQSADTPIDAASIIVNIPVDNLQEASGRLGLDTTNDRTATIEVSDPDGRTVRISQHSANRRVSSGPADEFNLTLEPGALVEATLELLRTEDDIPLRRLLNHVVLDARSLYRAGDEQAMDHLLDQLTRLAATFLDLDRQTWLHRTVDSLVAIYNVAFEGEAEITNKPPQQAAVCWLKIIERVEAVGALAVRREAWATVRDLASRKPDGMHHMYASWLRHATTMANRAGIVPANGRTDAEVSMISHAAETVRRLAELRPDLQTDDDRIFNSLNQFDFLACVVAHAMTANGGPGGVCYPHFAKFHGHRTQPITERLITDEALRQQIYPGTNRQLAIALHEIDETARKIAFAYDGWGGYTAPVAEFLRANLSA